MDPHTYKSGYLLVDDGHELYYEAFGNPELKSLLFIHGGPGSGFSEKLKNLFDPKKFNVIFYDQRGAGRSKPYLSLKENTTQNLIEDIKKLLDFLKIKSVVIIGPSWGATLGLLFAIQHPHYVSGMALMSIFLGTKKEAQRFVDGSVKDVHPEVWNRFASLVPENKRNDITAYYLDKMLHGSTDEKEKYFFSWALYDLSLSTGESAEEKLEKTIRAMSYQSLGLLTAYYITNNFFLSEGYILNNLENLKEIPVFIIQSKSDIVTLSAVASNLHNHLPKSSLELIDGTHSGKEIKDKLIEKAAALLDNLQ